MSKTLRKPLVKNVAIIFFVSIILMIPQFISGNMIMGSDALFHFNRFFDTAKQIELQDFQYFISTYGFQQTGRIVTPLYSQIFSYLFGIILLLCQSWYRFQIATNFLLIFTAGMSSYCLFQKITIGRNIECHLSIIYMTTYAVSYWVIRQGYSSWGAALLPLCMIPLIYLIRDKEFKALLIGGAMAMLFQVHFISCVFLAMIYLLAYLFCFFQVENKKQLIVKLLCSITIFFILSINVWYSLLKVYGGNQLVQPFVNREVYNQTVIGSSWYWLINPFILPIIIILVLFCVVKNFKILSPLNKFFSLVGIFFLILSSNLFPWKFLYEIDFKIVHTIQFPFRFFIPATICLLCSLALMICEEKLPEFKRFQKYVRVIVALCVVHAGALYTVTLSDWEKTDTSFINSGKHVSLTASNHQDIKDSFYNQDLSLALEFVEKSTPDYLPIYSDEENNYYDLYEKNVLLNENKFTKQVDRNGRLVIQWSSTVDKASITVPVIVYQKTQLTFNGEALTNLKLTEIGNPILKSKLGENMLILTYSGE